VHRALTCRMPTYSTLHGGRIVLVLLRAENSLQIETQAVRVKVSCVALTLWYPLSYS
jgi:hypothetical protein